LQNNISSINKILLKNKIKIDNLDNNIDNLFFNLETLFGLYKDYLLSKIDNSLNYKKALLEADFYDKFI
jgi:hypothetical protein